MTLTRSQYAIAASLAALVVAAPIAFRVMQETRFEPSIGEDSRRKPELAQEPAAGGERDEGRSVIINEPAAATTQPAKPAEPAPSVVVPNAGSLKVEEAAKANDAPAPGMDAKAKPERGIAQLGAAPRVDGRAAEMALGAAPALPATTEYEGQISLGKTDVTASATAERLADRRLLGAVPSATAVPAPVQIREPYAYLADADRQRQAAEPEFRDKFEAKEVNPVKQVAAEPVSTFSIDVDTASYAFVRRALNEGRLPPKASVRAEEMINYFDYAYPAPESASQPFKPTVTVVPSPWNATNKLVHIGIKGYDLKTEERPRANLVLLVDVSGSMQPADKLPLVKNGLRMLVDELKPDDTVALVTYASGSGVALEPTKISDKAKILNAIESLGAGGSTAGAEGIQDAYRLAEQNFDKAAVNRVILATDGDFNVGVTDHNDLKGLIERKREKGVFLSIIGVGQGNYNDSLMQTLAQNGNGVAAYADTLSEMRKVLVEEAASTLFPIAKDVKIQVEWNPSRVSAYRLIGYESRALKREDFNNDKVDAGDIGSGHTVTAIYEITPAGVEDKLVDDLRYGKPAEKTAAAGVPAAATGAGTNVSELGFLKMRFKLPKSDTSEPIGFAITDGMGAATLGEAPADVRFSIAVAGFAEVLRGSPYLKSFDLDQVQGLATAARGDDPFGLRAEFLNLVRLAKSAQP